jgi:SpoVK/Ycf46/Vps4 family AAA+-type ATPase
LDRHIINVNDIDKIKKVSDLKNIFYGDYINGRHIPTNKRIYVIDEFDKILDTIGEAPMNAAAAAAAAMGVMRANILNGVMGLEACDSGVISIDSDSDSRGNGSAVGGGGGGTTDASQSQGQGQGQGQGQDSGKKKRKNENGAIGPMGLMKAKSVINDADILTIMDGLVETSARIIICTANDPSKISEAFKRPGRLDEHIEFTKCTRKMICDLLELFYATKLSDEQRDKLYHSDNSNIEYKFSPAEVNKMCFNNVDTTGDTLNLKNIDQVIDKMISLVGCE